MSLYDCHLCIRADWRYYPASWNAADAAAGERSAAAARCSAGNTCSSDCLIHLSPHTSPGSVRPSAYLSIYQSCPVLSMDDMTSSSGHEKSIPCQLRGRASVSCDSAIATLSPNVNGVKADASLRLTRSDHCSKLLCSKNDRFWSLLIPPLKFVESGHVTIGDTFVSEQHI